MATKRAVGRPLKKDKVKLVPLYLTDTDKGRILKKFKNATEAVKKYVLPKCG